jgi:DNA-directed RNA polymerase II subunit RPB3
LPPCDHFHRPPHLTQFSFIAGLIPLVSDAVFNLKSIYESTEDTDEVDVNLSLHVKCTSDDTINVTSDDLIPDPKFTNVVPVGYNDRDDMSRTDRPVLLVKMRRGQELKLRCIARKGIGKDHAKWQPVATATYQYVPEITINHALVDTISEAQREEICAADPRKTFKYNKLTRRIEVVDPLQYQYDGEVLVKAEEFGVPGAIDIVQQQDHFLFRVEGTGAHHAGDVVTFAFEHLLNKIKLLQDGLVTLFEQGRV